MLVQNSMLSTPEQRASLDSLAAMAAASCPLRAAILCQLTAAACNSMSGQQGKWQPSSLRLVFTTLAADIVPLCGQPGDAVALEEAAHAILDIDTTDSQVGIQSMSMFAAVLELIAF